MRKIAIYISLVIAGMATAQTRVASFPHPAGVEQELRTQTNVRRMDYSVPVPSMEEGNVAEAMPVNIHPIVYRKGSIRPARNEEVQNTVGYVNPDGTFFLGIDEGGKGAWLSTNGVIGASADTIPCWVWRNTTTGSYRSIKYETVLSNRYPSYVEDECYFVDEQGNFCDSIVSASGWADAYAMGADGDAGYLWQMSTPLQVVTRNDGTKENFQLLQPKNSYSASNCAYAAGGLPSGSSADGLWPLTLAEPIQANGLSMDLIETKDEDGYLHYLFGTDSLTYATNQIDDTTTVYERYAPHKLRVQYDRPQAPLYIKSITLALSCENYSIPKKSLLQVNGLHLEVLDAEGNVIAQSDANNSNKSNLTYSKRQGQMLTFGFKTENEYEETVSEGFVVKDAFEIVITGFQAEDNFGIYAAETSSHDTHATMYYGDDEDIIKEVPYEPYVMLNGIMTRWDNYLDIAAFEEEGYETGVHGDTIDIDFVSAHSPYYKYQAHYAAQDLHGVSYFAWTSTFTPYDSVSLMWNMDLIVPEYVTIGADYTTNVGSADDPVTLWDYLRIFQIWIYATDTPELGDIIYIGKAGRGTYFKVTAIDGATAIEDIKQTPNRNVTKVIENGQLYILRDGKKYSVLGQ